MCAACCVNTRQSCIWTKIGWKQTRIEREQRVLSSESIWTDKIHLQTFYRANNDRVYEITYTNTFNVHAAKFLNACIINTKDAAACVIRVMNVAVYLGTIFNPLRVSDKNHQSRCQRGRSTWGECPETLNQKLDKHLKCILVTNNWKNSISKYVWMLKKIKSKNRSSIYIIHKKGTYQLTGMPKISWWTLHQCRAKASQTNDEQKKIFFFFLLITLFRHTLFTYSKLMSREQKRWLNKKSFLSNFFPNNSTRIN